MRRGGGNRHWLINIRTSSSNCAITNSCLLTSSWLLRQIETVSTCRLQLIHHCRGLLEECWGAGGECGTCGACSNDAKCCLTLTWRQRGGEGREPWCRCLLLERCQVPPVPVAPADVLPQSLWASTSAIVFTAKQLAALKIYLVMLSCVVISLGPKQACQSCYLVARIRSTHRQ